MVEDFGFRGGRGAEVPSVITCAEEGQRGSER